MTEGDVPAKARSRTRALPFDYSLDFDWIDFRQQPELYRIGRGEQGVLLLEPYKSELLSHWRFRTPEVGRASADTIFGMFVAYLDDEDFVGADMARKFLQISFTRAQRYANHKSGRKWSPDRSAVLPHEIDPIATESVSIFYTR